MNRGVPPPTPHDVKSVAQLIERLRLLQAWAGMSYRRIHREVVRVRAARGVPERPVLNTVYRCFRLDRTRLDVDLVVDVAHVLLGDGAAAEQWRQACWVVAGLSSAAAIVDVADTWPDDLSSFIGRYAELRKIVEIAEGRQSAVAITGMPGVGKSRLAVRAGHLLMARGRFADVRLAVDLRGHAPDRPPTDPGAVLEGFLRRLGLSGDRIQHLDLAGRVAKYRQLLAGRKGLILLDNAVSAEQVRPLLPESPGCVTLITSRCRLPELPTVDHLSLDVLPLEDAVALLRGGTNGGLDTEPELAADIAELLGYLPLALALVANRIHANPDWTLADHLDRLRHHQSNLRVDSGVEAAINLSYKDLPPDQQRAFRLLSLHPGNDIGQHAAAALFDTDLSLARHYLERLTTAGLLQRTTPQRYRFHNLINTYATARAHDEDPASAHRAALSRLSCHYLHTTYLATDLLYPYDKHSRPHVLPPAIVCPVPDQDSARGWLDTERANLLAVATHPGNDGPLVMAFSAALYRFLSMTCHLRDAKILHGHAVSTAQRCGDRAGEARALINLGDVYLRTGRYEHAVERFESALVISRDVRDLDAEGRALFQLGFIDMLNGRYERAAEHNRQALACHRQVGNRTGEACALGNLGWAYQVTGQLKRALDHHQRALSILREIKDRDNEARTLDDIGVILRLGADHDRAEDNHRTALSTFREVGDPEGETDALDNLGLVYQETGRLEQAEEHHRQALVISRGIGDRDNEARALNNLGTTYRRAGRHQEAYEHHRQALDLYRELGDPGGQATALNGLGDLDRAIGDLDGAVNAYAEAHQHASKIGQRHEQARADDGLGHAHHSLSDPERAREHWRRALAVYEELGVPDAAEVRARLTRYPGASR